MFGPVWLLLATVFAPVIAGVLGLLVPMRFTGLKVAVSTLGPIASLVFLGVYLNGYGVEAGRVALPWMPDLKLDLAFNADRLGAFFGLLVAGIGVLIVIYGRAYLGDDPRSLRRFYPLLLLFMTAMMGLVLSDDLILMLLFWELTSVSSFLLIGWEYTNKEAVKNALQAFVTTGVGGLTLFGGLILLGIAGEAWAFSELPVFAAAEDHETRVSATLVAALALMYVGVAAKSAQWPLHYWLPGAMLAPTPISAYLHSAAMVKAGIYLLARLWPSMSGLEIWAGLIITLGAVTMLLGAFIALQRDVLKQILAYTTVSQLGLLACAFGLAHYTWNGEPNLVWGNGQILNHAVYKAALFMLAGAVTHELGAKSLHQLHGVLRAGGRRTMYGVLFVLAGAALAALPGTYSFFAKEAFLYQIWHAIRGSDDWALWLLLLATVLTSIFNVAILVRFVQTFLTPPYHPPVGIERLAPGEEPPDGHGPKEADLQYYTDDKPKVDKHGHAKAEHDPFLWRLLIWLPAGLLVGVQLFGGIAGPWFARLLAPLEASPFYLGSHQFSLWYVLTSPSVPLGLSMLGIGLGVGLGLSPMLRGLRGDIHDRLFPSVYSDVLRVSGLVFGAFQTGRMRWYTWMTLMMVAFAIGWVAYIDWAELEWPASDARLPAFFDEPAGWLLCGLLCLVSLLMTLVRHRAARVLFLGVVGFAVTGIFYLYVAPDLALTQLSVEIVSLVLFLLVMSLLPDESPGDRTLVPLRLVAAAVVGVAMFGVTFLASTAERPARPHLVAVDEPVDNLGAWFLRNSYYGRDTAFVMPEMVGRGVVDRGRGHLLSFGTHVEGHGVVGPRAEVPLPFENERVQMLAAVLSDEALPPPPGAQGAITLHKGGGGANVVNVILVDFRSFDTLGEVAVLAVAAMGVWTLLRRPPSEPDQPGAGDRIAAQDLAGSDPSRNEYRPAGRATDEAFIDPYAAPAQTLFSPLPRGTVPVRSERIVSPVLKSAAMLLVPLAIMFSAYLFFKGHQSPGGGFVGGLATAVALVVYRMCFGSEALYRVLPVPERVLIGVGLALALGTGLVAVAMGLPMLTSNHGYLPLPGGGSFHWSSVLAFDLGVYLIVVGSVVGMIDALARELEDPR